MEKTHHSSYLDVKIKPGSPTLLTILWLASYGIAQVIFTIISRLINPGSKRAAPAIKKRRNLSTPIRTFIAVLNGIINKKHPTEEDIQKDLLILDI